MTNKQIYRTLCETKDTIPIYSQAFWMDAVCGPDNWDVLLYEKKGNILGAMPYYIKSKLGLRYITQPPFTQQNGVWIDYPENQQESKRISMEKEVMIDLIKKLESLPICYYQQSFSPNVTNWLPFYWKGYLQTTRYTYRLPDISRPNQLFESFQHNKRKNINKARKENFQIGFDMPAGEFYSLHQKSLAKQGTEIGYSFSLFERICDAAYAHRAGRTIYMTRENGELLCALFNLWDARWGYNLISAIDPNTRSSGASDLLVYSMLEYLSDKVTGYDFEGSMISGVEDSFRHFGATQTPYFTIHKTYTKNPLLRYAIAKKLR